MCGMPGLAPGDLIDIDMDAVDGEGVIHLSNADYLTRPLRLSADEALALVLALRTLREIAGPGKREAVDRALKKLEAAAGNLAAHRPGHRGGDRGPRRDPGPGQRRPAARQAARPDLRRGVPGRDDPARWSTRCGSSCSRATATWRPGATRRRRCGPSGWTGSPRSRSPTSTSSRTTCSCKDLSTGWFETPEGRPAGHPRARAVGGLGRRVLPDRDGARRPTTGGWRSSVRVTDPAWLRGLLLRLGGGARVVSPAGAGDSAVEVAQEALDQYAALGYRRPRRSGRSMFGSAIALARPRCMVICVRRSALRAAQGLA